MYAHARGSILWESSKRACWLSMTCRWWMYGFSSWCSFEGTSLPTKQRKRMGQKADPCLFFISVSHHSHLQAPSVPPQWLRRQLFFHGCLKGKRSWLYNSHSKGGLNSTYFLLQLLCPALAWGTLCLWNLPAVLVTSRNGAGRATSTAETHWARQTKWWDTLPSAADCWQAAKGWRALL